MKAAVIRSAGGAENFFMEEFPVPTPLEGQVLIKVKAFGLNRSELMTRKGLSPDVHFPRVLGIECVGEVAHDPSGTLAKGQKVAAFMGGMGRDFDGSYAEYTLVPRAIVMPFESTLSWEILGALPEMFQTAYGSLHRALKIKSGETLLIRGGTSSVGLLALQLAKEAGLFVISTTRNEAKRELLVANGADEVLIDNGSLAEIIKNQSQFKIDKVLELVGTTTLQDSLKTVVSGGSVCMTGILSEQWSIAEFAPMNYIPATVNLTVYDSGEIRIEGKYFQKFVKDIEKGFLKPAIKRIFNLNEIVAAHHLMESSSGGGKIVVLP
ncbi:zinc-binding alcohol dehydrogenase family protein [Flavobacterium sp. ENC]|uniref:zinc-binding alcohol dehydrogenase family protein n=1 Tax=Flavobacterium sp. ENC TaxID=2897330 RepID=UPI001E324C06|nr:zinc-binding alcohol dehydrogenase family protein [Flavobacterium sp. ENC]MCD0465933.1 zinc-binding alcohol dehydrogenase family protein [Flavobacterium sp. ENC]